MALTWKLIAVILDRQGSVAVICGVNCSLLGKKEALHGLTTVLTIHLPSNNVLNFYIMFLCNKWTSVLE